MKQFLKEMVILLLIIVGTAIAFTVFGFFIGALNTEAILNKMMG